MSAPFRFAVAARVAAVAASVAFAALPAWADGIPHAGDSAPAFSIPNAAGGNVNLAAFKGKPVYINFFATWCGPCNAEAPNVARLYAKYRAQGLVIVGINELEDKSKALDFAHEYKWAFPIGVDADGDTGKAYGASVGLPVQAFVGRDGKISTFRLGQMDPADVEDAIKKIVAH